MFKVDQEPPLAEEDRDGVVEPPRAVAPGQKLILLATAGVAALLILWGVASRNHYFGLFGAASHSKDEVHAEARPVNVPEVRIPMALGGQAVPPPSYVECPGGLRLPIGLNCPESVPSVPVASSAPSSDESLAQRVRERRLRSSIAFAASAVGVRPGVALGGAPAAIAPAPPTAAETAGSTVLGRSLSGTATAGVSASLIGNPSLTLAKGTLPDCTLLTAILSDQPGFLKCLLSAPVMSMDGKVVLMEAGTTLEGEYAAGVQPGQHTIFTLWTRAVTPHFVVVPLASPGADPLGRAGTTGSVDNKWIERFAGALLFSLFEDAKQVAIAKDDARATRRAANQSGDTYNIGTQGTLSQLGNTDSTTQSVVQEMLRQGGQARPSLYKNQGEIIKIFVARDIDFSSVYALRPVDAPSMP